MKIYNNQWDELQSLTHVEHSKTIKKQLVDEIALTLQEGYYSRTEGVKRAIDKMCFLAKEKGFAFASPSYYMEKFGIGKDAIYKVVKAMIEANLVTRCNRSSSKQNGLGCWVLIFHSHPNFESISTILNLKKKAEPKAEQKAESDANPVVPTVEEEEIVPTFSLPITTSFKKENVKPSNVIESEEEEKTSKFVKYVPKAINELYAGIFNLELADIWRKITLAVKKIGIELSKEDVIQFGKQTIKQLFLRVKKGVLSLDEMCAYVYSTMRNIVYNNIGQGFLDDMIEEEDVFYYSSVEVESGYVKTQYFSYDAWVHKSVEMYRETKKETVEPLTHEQKLARYNAWRSTISDEEYAELPF